MKIVAIVSQKGGVGKTTAAIEIAYAAHRAGLVTAIIDLDPQGTAAKWGARRETEGPSVIAGKASRLTMILETARMSGADLAIIDTPPCAEETALEAANISDFVLIPTRPGGFDFEAIQTTIEMVEQLRRPGAVLINSVPTNRQHLATTTLGKMKDVNFPVAPALWMERAAFADLGADDKPVLERDPESKASQEVADVFSWLCEQIGLTPGVPAGENPAAQFNRMSQAMLKVQLAALMLSPMDRRN